MHKVISLCIPRGKEGKRKFQKKRKFEAQNNIKYLEEILFSVENADRPDILDEIEEELNEYLLNERGFGANGASSNNKGKEKRQGLRLKALNIKDSRYFQEKIINKTII